MYFILLRAVDSAEGRKIDGLGVRAACEKFRHLRAIYRHFLNSNSYLVIKMLSKSVRSNVFLRVTLRAAHISSGVPKATNVIEGDKGTCALRCIFVVV